MNVFTDLDKMEVKEKQAQRGYKLLDGRPMAYQISAHDAVQILENMAGMDYMGKYNAIGTLYEWAFERGYQCAMNQKKRGK